MIRVLVVEDDPVAAVAHERYVGRLDGFDCVGRAASCAQAQRRLVRDRDIDLVLLDMRLPDGDGLDLLGRIRAVGVACAVMPVTSVRDADSVRRALAHGVTHYLLKPFTWDTFQARMLAYAAYREQSERDGQLEQVEVDRLMGLMHAGGRDRLPKGLDAVTLETVTAHSRGRSSGWSAQEVSRSTGLSRVTVRRYLEHLVDTGRMTRHQRYGGAGRPEVEYRWQL